MKQPSLRPSDIVTAIEMAITPGSKLADIADRTSKSIGETHNAIGRLGQSGLLLPDSRSVAAEPLVAFVRWGVPFAFPAVTGGPAVGVPTALIDQFGAIGTATTGSLPTPVEFVWPSADGPGKGTALIPIFPAAPKLLRTNRQLAGLLSLLDLVRVGGAREREAALAAFAQGLAGPVAK